MRNALDIGAWLAPVWANQERPVVFTSATLSIAGSLDYFCRRVGLSGQNTERTRTALLATPFAAAQSMRATVRNAPDPGSPAFAQFCADTVVRLQRKLMRNTLVLFTSHSMMREVDERVRKAGIERDFPLFSQVTGQSRTQLMQQFKRARKALLLGTSSFWEGVDAPGEQCEIVIIPRLPFQVPTEPLTQALARKAEEEFGESFFSYSVPEAIIRLRQGAGRLIRSAEDRGALVILDCRMVTKGYGRAFAASLDGPLETFDSIDSLESGVDTFFASEGGRRYVPVEEQGEETDDWQA